MKWTPDQIPDQTDRTALITGANSGIGFEAARELAAHGATVVLAARDPERGQRARDAIARDVPRARLELLELDLADLGSIRAAAERFADEHDALHLLINNAGVMALPARTTADGFEMQIGTNHLGHFALTGLLLDRVTAAGGGRVVTVSSVLHRRGRIRLDDLHFDEGYDPWRAYGQSKLANLLFTYELDRRLRAAGRDAIAAACHPGYASTNLQAAGPRMERKPVKTALMRLGNKLIGQSARVGSWPTLYAATAPDVEGGDFIGPRGPFELAGAPKKVRSNDASRDTDTARRLWTLSEQLTGVELPLPAPEA